MKIIAHRGLWNRREEGNTIESFREAFMRGYGIETDIRDYGGRLVVSHNVAAETAFDLEDVLKIYSDMGCGSALALNIKADGLQKLLWEELVKYRIENYFVFDMSVPEQVVFHKKKFRVFTRMSEYETVPVLLERSQGIWMDEWEKSWISAQVIQKFRDEKKIVAVISPEIHGREREFLWNELKRFEHDQEVLLCTDIPIKAEEFFYGH